MISCYDPGRLRFQRHVNAVKRQVCSDATQVKTFPILRDIKMKLAALSLLTWSALAAARAPIKKTLAGHIDPDQAMTFVYVPFDVPPGVTSIYVLQSYSEKGAGNSLDLGIFDERGAGRSGGMTFISWVCV